MSCTGTFSCLKIRVIKFLDQDRKLIPDENEIDNKLKKAPISSENEQLSLIYVKTSFHDVSWDMSTLFQKSFCSVLHCIKFYLIIMVTRTTLTCNIIIYFCYNNMSSYFKNLQNKIYSRPIEILLQSVENLYIW